MLDHTHTTVRSITKTVRIACDPQAVFDYLADLGNWPHWAIVNVKSTSRSDDPEWWDMVTPRGAARLRLRADARHGILDHDFVDSQASWPVYARVIANGGGAEFMITLFQPPSFTDAFFDEQMKLVDIELAKLRRFSRRLLGFGGLSDGAAFELRAKLQSGRFGSIVSLFLVAHSRFAPIPDDSSIGVRARTGSIVSR